MFKQNKTLPILAYI